MLDETYCTEGKDGLGWVGVELRLRSMEGNVRGSSWVLSGRAREVDGLLVDLLDGMLDLVTMGVRSGVRDVGMKETEWGEENALTWWLLAL